MRVAVIGHKRLPSREGGIEVVVSELYPRMAARGHEVVAYDRRAAGDDPAPRTWRGVRVKSVPTIDAHGLAALSSSFTATLRAIRMRPDVVHYHAEGPCVPLILAHLAGLTTVATIHGLDWQRAKWGRFASAYIKLGERVAARFADEIIVLSASAQAYFEETYGRATRIIPNHIEPVETRPAHKITERWGLTPGSYLLYLGRLVPEKGVHRLIEAFSGLETSKRLVIAGSEADAPDYARTLAELSHDDPRILITGFVEGEELEELFSNAYLFVLPSDIEGMPMSLLEAMAYGCCCVTSDIPECTDVTGASGVAVAQGSVDDLRAQLAELIADPARVERLGEAAREHVSSLYTWDTVVEQTLETYETARADGAARRHRARAESHATGMGATSAITPMKDVAP